MEQHSESEDEPEMAFNNLVEIFSLSNDEFSQSLNAILAAQTTDKSPPKYSLRSAGAISKPCCATKIIVRAYKTSSTAFSPITRIIGINQITPISTKRRTRILI